MMLDRLNTERGGDVGLARAGAAKQHDVTRTINKLSPVQLEDHGFVHFAERKVEAFQIVRGQEPRCLDLVSD